MTSLTSASVTSKLSLFLDDRFLTHPLNITDLTYMFNHTSYESMSYGTRIAWNSGCYVYLLPEFRRLNPAQAFFEIKKSILKE